MTAPIIARITALKATPTPGLRTLWKDIFETEPPRQNRRFLESRLAYRIQELEYGELKLATVERLEALGEALDGGAKPRSAAGAPTTGRSPAPG